MKKLLVIAGFLLASCAGNSQTPFEIQLEPITISGLGGIQSYAFGQHNGKWLIIGGRLDGLHRRQPWASFDVAGHNNQLIVVDPVAKQQWTAPLSTLPTGLQEQLSSTNMEFYQDGQYLYIIGGYGFSNTSNDHITYPNLAAVDVPSTITAIINGTSVTSYFRQITDNQFAVTGGRLNKIYNTYYLTGGQRFDGRYNPMSHPTFTQTYTESIRKFTVSDDGINLAITHLPTITDAANLHRRDFNVTPQIMPNGEQGLTAFSGVFQVNADLPFLNCVNIDSSGYTVNNSFTQYYNHYHCANIPLYDASNNEMHTVFFGGIAQFYDSLGYLIQDNNVPFVKTIARVTRTSNGNMMEYKLPVEMPALLGAGSEFIPMENIPSYSNDVIKLDSLLNDTTLVGYIFGGINSSAQNIFWINNGTQSEASNEIYKVHLVRTIGTDINNPESENRNNLNMKIYPNPTNGLLNIDFFLNYRSSVAVHISDLKGNIIEQINYNKNELSLGENHLEIQINEITNKAAVLVTLITSKEKSSKKLIK